MRKAIRQQSVAGKIHDSGVVVTEGVRKQKMTVKLSTAYVSQFKAANKEQRAMRARATACLAVAVKAAVPHSEGDGRRSVSNRKSYDLGVFYSFGRSLFGMFGLASAFYLFQRPWSQVVGSSERWLGWLEASFSEVRTTGIVF